jgi:UDP-glucose 4-epimerase
MGAHTNVKRNKVSLILGGGGFIGTTLSEHLVRTGHAVISVSKSMRAGQRDVTEGIEYVTADLADPSSYAALLDSVDQVMYLASATTPGSSTANPYLDIDANLIPFLRFLEINAEARRPVMFASSGGTVYGRPQYIPIDEVHLTEPISPYGIVKLTMEKYLKYFAENYGFEYRILRIANPYGGRHHRRKDQGVIDVFARKIVNDEKLVIWGSGGVVRDYVHISDVCRAFIMAMEFTGPETVFNIGSGKGRSILDIVGALCAHTGKTPELIFENGRDYDIRENVLDITRARELLNWTPTMNFDDGLAETLRNMS